MKTNKRALAILTSAFMAITPLAATGMAAFAEDEAPATHSITVTPKAETTSDFAAYQIFTGNVQNDKLTEIEWGSGMPSDKSAFLTALQGKDVFKVDGTNVFASLTAESSAEDYSKAIAKLGDRSEAANELARILDDVVTSPITDTNAAANIIGGVASGYYLVKETSAISDTNPLSLNLLKVVGKDEPINAKEDLPSIDKLIDEKGGVEANTASIGDTVPYIIKSKVPDMTGYSKYFFILNDTLSEGLTYVDNSISISVGGVEISDYTFTEDDGEIKIVFNNFYANYNDQVGDDIVVKYSALVNENADMTQTGNINTAQLTYSNNPNINPRGENEPAPPEEEDNPDTPEDETKPDPTGQTPEEKTVTYVTQIDLLKTKIDGTTPLANAKFKIEGYKKTVGVAAGKYYVEDASGTYYRLADGSYTTDAPNGTTTFAYESTNKKYKEVQKSELTGDEYLITDELTTGADGKINFAGLGEGVYTITETEAPTGFNKLAQPITVTITATDVSITGCTWGKTLSDPNNATTAGEFIQGNKTGTDSSLPLTVKNKEGSTLPSTGGIGTKLFYLFGGILVAGSGVLLITKKRMAKEN